MQVKNMRAYILIGEEAVMNKLIKIIFIFLASTSVYAAKIEEVIVFNDTDHSLSFRSTIVDP
jgi:hypothetical protein